MIKFLEPLGLLVLNREGQLSWSHILLLVATCLSVAHIEAWPILAIAVANYAHKRFTNDKAQAQDQKEFTLEFAALNARMDALALSHVEVVKVTQEAKRVMSSQSMASTFRMPTRGAKAPAEPA